MKITKRQLRRIIKEEKARLLHEAPTPYEREEARRFSVEDMDTHPASRRKSSVETKTPEQWADFVYDVISTELWDMGSDEIIEGSSIGDGLEIIRRTFKDAARGPTR
jgi:spore coat polysaccharide biosynthesis protein SpsF (cytidylyltransferase family)